MAYATEMLIQFAKEGFSMIEVPTTYKARKYGRPKLRRFKSGIEIFSTIFRGFWMRIRLESVKRIGSKIGLNEEKGYAVAIFLALIIVSATVIGYYVVFRPQAEPYNTIYLLDANKKAVDYPEVLVANQNSTFNVYVNVENHMATSARLPSAGKNRQRTSPLFQLTPNLAKP